MGVFDGIKRFNNWRSAIVEDIRGYNNTTDDFDIKQLKKLKDSVVKSPLPESKKKIQSGDWFNTAEWLIDNDPYFRYSPIKDDIKQLLSMKKKPDKSDGKEAIYGVELANDLVKNRLKELIETFCDGNYWLVVGVGSIRWIDDFDKKFYG